MKKLSFAVLSLALAGLMSLPAHADNLTLNTWDLFQWNTAGEQVHSSTNATSLDFYAAGPVQINVTDGYYQGDAFTVYDNGALLGTTILVDALSTGTCSDPRRLLC